MNKSSHAERRTLSIVGFFIAIAFAYSWPIFFVVDAWLAPLFFANGKYAEGVITSIFGHMIAMAGPAIAAVVLWRRCLDEPMPPWKWGKARHYIMAAASMLALWTLPGLIGLAAIRAFHFRNPIELYIWVAIAASLTVGWLAGLGEETGWCAFLLPQLAPRIGKGRALLVSGTIRGLWHWPVLAGPLLWQAADGDRTLSQIVLLSAVLLIQLVISNALFGSLFGSVWYKTESLPLLGWLHQWFDTARDITSLLIIGYSTSLWFKMFWAIPFYSAGFIALMLTAQKERANLLTLAPPKNIASINEGK